MTTLDEFPSHLKSAKIDLGLDILIDQAVNSGSVKCQVVTGKVVEIIVGQNNSTAFAVDKALFRALLARCCIRVQEANPQDFSGGLYGFKSRVYLPFAGVKAADLTIETSNTLSDSHLYLETH